MRLFLLTNQMLIGNGLANLIGVNIAKLISQRSISPPPPTAMSLFARVDFIFPLLSFALVLIVTIVYELPIRRFLNRCYTLNGYKLRFPLAPSPIGRGLG